MNLIAIDIGLNLTKVLEADLNKKGILEIITLESFKTPYKEGEIERKAFFGQLYKFIPLSRIKASRLAISVPSSAINFTNLQLPKMPKEDLDKAVLREAKRKILPLPQEADIFTYIILSETKVKEIAQLNILAGAGTRGVIEKYVSLFKAQEIIPQLIGSTLSALMMYFHEYKPSPTENWALIDIGFKNTSVVIFNKTDVALMRSIPFACFNFFEAVAKKTGCSLERAEDLFFSEQLREELVSESWQYLLAELRRSFAYYKEITNGQKLDSILFSGGIFKAGGSLDFLRKNMGGKLEVLNLVPSRSILARKFSAGDLLSQGPLFATALGLVLSLKSIKRPALNFLPPEIPRERRLKKIELISEEALIVVAGVLIFLTMSLSARIILIKVNIANLHKGFSESEYQDFTEKAAKINLRLSNLEKQKDLAGKISQYRFPWEKLFTILSNTIPEDAFIKEMSVEKASTLNLKGAIVGDYEQASRELDKFYRGLVDSGFFSEIKLEPLKLEDIVIKGRAEKEALTEIKEREFNLQAQIKSK